METLGIGRKNLLGTTERRLSEVAGSYTYFADNDVLLAKITPCFENGKVGIASGLKNGVGFGSSE
jgi:type I restriction enzyme S subunit